ncbi:MAG: NifB/NifX family molybdenum-iron cluster-binding protein [Spirochaetota bacterium]
MKYALPTDDGSTVGSAFGRAASFAIYNTNDSSMTILKNEGTAAEHGAGTGAVAFLADKAINAVIAPEIGPKTANALRIAGIRVETAVAGTPLHAAVDQMLVTQ